MTMMLFGCGRYPALNLHKKIMCVCVIIITLPFTLTHSHTHAPFDGVSRLHAKIESLYPLGIWASVFQWEISPRGLFLISHAPLSLWITLSYHQNDDDDDCVSPRQRTGLWWGSIWVTHLSPSDESPSRAISTHWTRENHSGCVEFTCQTGWQLERGEMLHCRCGKRLHNMMIGQWRHLHLTPFREFWGELRRKKTEEETFIFPPIPLCGFLPRWPKKAYISFL